MEFVKKNRFVLLIALLWLLLFQAGLRCYGGSKLLYVVFSVISLAHLLSAVYVQISFGYLFLSVFLWLGFWFKLTANFLLFGFFPFGEPVGAFDSSSASWDLVLVIVCVASLGAVAGRGICALYRFLPYGHLSYESVPAWYPERRNILWIGLATLTIVAAIFNTVYGVHLIGLVPRTILPWPGNAMMAWFLNIGAALTISVLIGWDCALGRGFDRSIYAILAEGFLTSTSVLSRSAFLFHVIPQTLSLFRLQKARARISCRKSLVLGCLMVMLFACSIVLVSHQRDLQYASSTALPTPKPKASDESQAQQQMNVSVSAHSTLQPLPVTSSLRLILIHQLVVNRWIGIEGAMAISSYPNKSGVLAWEMLLEKREIGKASAYQAISNSGYQAADSKNQFASMPGIVGFLYYGGSFYMVFIGMLLLTAIIIFSERLIFNLVKNSILCSLYGMLLANTTAQFGMTPRQDLPQYLMLFCFVCCIWQLQRWATMNHKLRDNK